MKSARGFTLIELLVVLALIGLLAAIGFSVANRIGERALRIECGSNLRQLHMAVTFHIADHGTYPRYLTRTPAGNVWYFGRESTTWIDGEAERELDPTAGPLGPYLMDAGGVERCPSFDYRSAAWKPKFKTPSWGYGYNWRLGGGFSGEPMRPDQVSNPAHIVLFGDCAQVNTFQAPASPDNPMLEEFYILNESYRTVHFRHGGRANMLFVDGSVRSFEPEPGTLDLRVPGAVLGRITPSGSTDMLE